MLHIRFFGFPTITLNDQPVGKLTNSPTLTNLFAFLVFHRSRPHARSWLADMLWPELPEARARRNLNNALWELRSALKVIPSSGPSLIVSDSQTVQFESTLSLWLDTDEFSKTVALMSRVAPTFQDRPDLARQIEQAIDLYRGEFLEGIYAEWCVAPRERFRENHLTLLETLSRHYQAHKQLEAALRIAQRLAQVEPLREEAHFQLVELSLRLNRFPEARIYYRQYESIWQQELKVEPSARMQALAYRMESFRPPDNSADQSRLSRDAQLLEQALTMLRSPPARSSTEEAHAQAQREQMWEHIAGQAEQIGLAFQTRNANAEALRYLNLAAETLTNLPDSPERQRREVNLRRQCNVLYDLSGDRKRQAANLQRTEQIANQLGDSALQIEMLAHRAWMLMRQGDYSQAIGFLRDMQVRCRKVNDQPQEAVARRLLGIAYDETGDFLSALKEHSQALVLSEAIGFKAGIRLDLINLSSVATGVGQYMEAINYLERALTLNTPDDPPLVKAVLAGNLGNVWIKLGQLATASNLLHEAMHRIRQTEDRETECWLGGRLAFLYQRQNRVEDALPIAHRYYHWAVELQAPRRMAELAELLASLYCERQDGAIATEWACQSIEIAQKYHLRRYELRGTLRLAQAQLVAGNIPVALRHAQSSVDQFEKWRQPLEEEAELYWTLAQCAQAIQDETLANYAHQRAQQTLLTLANHIRDPQLSQAFLEYHPLQN